MVDLAEITETVKVLSWHWSLDRLKISPCAALRFSLAFLVGFVFVLGLIMALQPAFLCSAVSVFLCSAVFCFFVVLDACFFSSFVVFPFPLL
ncbi:hypothetical protein L195_g055571, partial [Trifolium pratense]